MTWMNKRRVEGFPAAAQLTAAEPMIGLAPVRLNMFLLGATGRTGSIFLADALARGHIVTIYVRDVRKLSPAVVSHSNLRVFEGALDDHREVALAIRTAKPNVVYVMLASERAPYSAVSTGTRSVLLALQEVRTVIGETGSPTPFISIAGWGVGPTRAYITGTLSRMLVDTATTLFWSRPLADFEKQVVALEEAKNAGLVQPILVLPPILSNGKKTDTYLSGDAAMVKDAMRLTKFASRASISDLCLKLGEKSASGKAVPQWNGIINS